MGFDWRRNEQEHNLDITSGTNRPTCRSDIVEVDPWLRFKPADGLFQQYFYIDNFEIGFSSIFKERVQDSGILGNVIKEGDISVFVIRV